MKNEIIFFELFFMIVFITNIFYKPIIMSNSKPLFNSSNGKPIFSILNPQLNVYIDLNTITDQINKISTSYINGDLNAVIQFIQSGAIYTIANLLNIITLNSQQYPDILQSVQYNLNILNNFSKIVNQYYNCQIIAEKLTIAKYYENIILDTRPGGLLDQYLEKRKQTIRALPTLYIVIDVPDIKQEYINYIKLYGIPKNGVYDTGLMGAIIANLVK